MPLHLTANAIPAILSGNTDLKPLVQVVDIRKVNPNTLNERTRLIISDSVTTHQALLSKQLNGAAREDKLRKGSIVQLTEYICSNLQDRVFIVIVNMETIMLDCDILGNPSMIVEPGAAPQNLTPDSFGRKPALNNSNIGAQSSARASFNDGKTPSFQNPGNNMQSFRPTVQPPYQPPPNYKHHGAIMRNEAPARIIPISAMNPYQGRWAIKARVTAKGDLRRYNNAKGDGKVFSFDLLDSDGGEIRVTCFNAVVDRFYDTIQVGKVYVISKGSLKPAQKNFNHLKNEWEIFLEATSSVDLCPDEDDSIPKQHFSFRSISEIENTESNSIVDMICVVATVNPSVPVMRKNGMETQRRVLNLKDQSGRSVELTLWGDFCNREGQQLQEMVETGAFPVLAVKSAKVSDFSGKSIGTISATQLFINPDFPEARILRDWFDRGGKEITSQSISKDFVPGGSRNDVRKTLAQIKDEGLGRSDKPDWITAKATLIYIKTDNFYYTACPLKIGDRTCSKKVTKSGNSRWVCDRCNQDFEECDYRYILQAQFQDHTGLTWVTAFQEAGEEIVGHSAKEMYTIKNELEDENRFAEIMRGCMLKDYILKLKIKEEVYGDEQKVKITVVKAENVNYSQETRFLMDMISKY